MTRLRRWFRNALERLLLRYNEGPTPPARLRAHVVEFARMHPHATRDQWIEFCAGQLAITWLDAYVRGEEWAERDLGSQQWRQGLTPERLMDEYDPGWRDSPAVDLGPDYEVPEAYTDAQLEADDVRAANDAHREGQYFGSLGRAKANARPR